MVNTWRTTMRSLSTICAFAPGCLRTMWWRRVTRGCCCCFGWVFFCVCVCVCVIFVCFCFFFFFFNVFYSNFYIVYSNIVTMTTTLSLSRCKHIKILSITKIRCIWGKINRERFKPKLKQINGPTSNQR